MQRARARAGLLRPHRRVPRGAPPRRACATPRSSSTRRRTPARGIDVRRRSSTASPGRSPTRVATLGITSRPDPLLPPRSQRGIGDGDARVGTRPPRSDHRRRASIPPSSGTRRRSSRRCSTGLGAEGFLTVAHAGEEGPPEYIWQALDLLHVVAHRSRRAVRRGRRGSSSGWSPSRSRSRSARCRT